MRVFNKASKYLVFLVIVLCVTMAMGAKELVRD